MPNLHMEEEIGIIYKLSSAVPFCLLDRVPNFFCLSYKYPNCGYIRNHNDEAEVYPTVVATNRFAIDIYSNFHFLICKSCISVMQ